MKTQLIELRVYNSGTILRRVLQTVENNNLVIGSFIADEPKSQAKTALIRLIVKGDQKKLEYLIKQLDKIADVIEVNAA